MKLIALGLTLVAATACSNPGEISGDFYYATRGADVKRLADREITLVRATPEFDAAWKTAVTGFKAAVEAAEEEYQQAVRREAEHTKQARLLAKRRDALLIETIKSMNVEAMVTDDMLIRTAPELRGADATVLNYWRAYVAGVARDVGDRKAQDGYRKADDEAAMTQAALTRAASDHRMTVQNTWEKHVVELLVWSKWHTARTDATGHFKFSTPAGRHYLYAQVAMLFPEPHTVTWWTPIDVKSGPQTIDLTTSNVGAWPFPVAR